MTITTLTPQRLVLPGGITLEYVEQGRRRAAAAGAPPSLVLLHGVTDSWRSFEGVLARLPREQHVVALSQRGHGGSSKDAASHGTADHAGDVLAALDALDLERPVLAGHSMGAHHVLRVAADLAESAPQRLRALVLIGAFAGFSDKLELAAWHAATVAPLADPVPHAVAEAFQRDTLAREIGAAQLELFVQESLRVPAHIWRETFAGFFDDGWMARLAGAPGLALPARLIWGEHDTFVPRADQDRLLGWLPRAHLSVYEATGHAVHWEQPERVAAEIAAFIGSV